MDKAYVDFGRLYAMNLSQAFFVTRAKRRMLHQRRYSCKVEKELGLRCDQTIVLLGVTTAKAYPDPLRRISYVDLETGKRLIFLTNNFHLPALRYP
jgi:hypothetical protein